MVLDRFLICLYRCKLLDITKIKVKVEVEDNGASTRVFSIINPVPLQMSEDVTKTYVYEE